MALLFVALPGASESGRCMSSVRRVFPADKTATYEPFGIDKNHRPRNKDKKKWIKFCLSEISVLYLASDAGCPNVPVYPCL